MTLEIYDYLWIRNVLIALEPDDLLANITNQEEYTFVVKCISDLLKEEDFPLVFPQSQSTIEKLIEKHRFEYVDKSLNQNINGIICKLNEYKNMSFGNKNHLINKFYNNEITARKLAFTYSHSIETINCLIQNDIHTYRSLFYTDYNGNQPVELTVMDILDYASLTNLIMTKYPDFFEKEHYTKKTIHNLSQLATIKTIPFDIKISIKKTLKELSKDDTKPKRLFL